VVRDLVLGPADGRAPVVTKGLQAGDKVVLEGLDRLREGRSVIVNVTG
jgi:multidrug efflux system membrane fusion protein